jgi:hypothetical protein
MGLFLTPNPAGQLASPYSYTGFDPLNGIDPDGRWFQALWAAISPFIPLIFGVAAFVSTVVQTGNVGLAIKAGVFAGLTSYAISGFSEYALVPVIQESGFVDVPTYAFASVAQGGYSAAQSIRKGDILSGVLSALVLAGGLAASAEQAIGARAGSGDLYGHADGFIEAADTDGGTRQQAPGSDASSADQRAPDTVYVTGHRVGKLGPYHLAAEYRPLGGEASWISGHTPDDGIPVLSDLFADPITSGMNHPADAPMNNVTIATVTPPKGMAPGTDWNTLSAASANCCGGLDYALFPSRFFDGYNSNSFLVGLIQATGGTPSAPLSGFVGAAHPIPPEYYRP